jgi:lauroyl/myristoyl acyltransferase
VSGAGAGLFTVATAAFLFLGYRFLRAAETPTAWRARRQARRARRVARGLRAMAERDARERDRFIDAYLIQVRRLLQRACPAEQHLALESAIRRHLCGGAAPS